MIDVLPQLAGGCINYWEAGNWALNDEAEPKGARTRGRIAGCTCTCSGAVPRRPIRRGRGASRRSFRAFADKAVVGGALRAAHAGRVLPDRQPHRRAAANEVRTAGRRDRRLVAVRHAAAIRRRIAMRRSAPSRSARSAGPEVRTDVTEWTGSRQTFNADRRPDARPAGAGDPFVERCTGSPASAARGKGERQHVRVAVVDPAPRERAGERHRGEERVRQVQRGEEDRGQHDPGGLPTSSALRAGTPSAARTADRSPTGSAARGCARRLARSCHVPRRAPASAIAIAASAVSSVDRQSAGTNARGLTPQSPLLIACQIASARTSTTGIGVTQPGAIGSITHV